ncbi:RING-H2 finger protein ATL52-like [Phoenix dactylifera]|uniref:RING-type E3 ubiquitin transferase n=1 Tax=Phoenix dactylifera TaxID=42345 RepID=A0A8B7CRC0_PHODC|nr:RING-H2 finger protein ATL52-like [Phoenix dactylifera]
MALHHPRILFPVPNATLCITNCDEPCQFYSMCSPPPTYSSLPFNSTPDATTIQFHHGSTLLPNLLIAAAALVAASFILLAVFYALLRFRGRRRRLAAAAAAAGGGGEDDLFVMGEPADVHHVWYVRTVGLDEPTIQSIAAWAYKPGDGLLGAADDGCPVCLADFREGELLRLLPKCGHAFHLPCIDTWLRSHLNCPLCRAPIVALPHAAASDPVEPNTGSSALEEDSQMAVRPQEADRGGPEVETERGIAETGGAIDPIAAPSSPPPSSQLRAPSDLGEDGLQQVCRSVSMGSSSLGVLLLKRDPQEGPGEERKDPDLEEESTPKNRGKQGHASKGAAQQKDPQEMEGSLSSSSGRFLLTRHGRGQSAVLPL